MDPRYADTCPGGCTTQIMELAQDVADVVASMGTRRSDDRKLPGGRDKEGGTKVQLLANLERRFVEKRHSMCGHNSVCIQEGRRKKC